MERQTFDISIEDLICRVPALFPYIEWNDDGTLDVHVATDSPNGSYGKIVDNMNIPEGVRLTNYVRVPEDEVQAYYSWNAWNTIGLSQPKEVFFSNSGSAYLRQVLWYVYRKSGEDLPYAEEVTELPTYVSDDSPQEIKMGMKGVDGLPVECDGNVLYEYYEKVGNYAYYQRKDIINPNTTYSYRDIVGRDNTFIKFVDTGIGLIEVDRELLNLTDEIQYPDVPESVYLSQVKGLLDVYESYQKASEHYVAHYVANGKPSAYLLEKHTKYIRMGGNNMTNWLKQILQKAYDVANEYMCHAENKCFNPELSLNLMLTKKTGVFGLDSVDVNEFVPGNRYYDGDLLTYDGRTYICVLDRYVSDGNNFPYVLKTRKLQDGTVEKGLFVLSGSEYELVNTTNISYVYDALPDGHITDYVVLNGVYYFWDADESKYAVLGVTEYITGVFDNEEMRLVFDTQHFIPLSELHGENYWYDDEHLDGEKYRYFAVMGGLPPTHEYDYIKVGNNIFQWDEEFGNYVGIETENERYVISESVNSKLKDLKIFREYINPFGVSEEPDGEEDWLYYYKVGAVTGLVTETDSVGNIINDSDDYDEGLCYELHAYGNIITGIDYDSSENTVTFTYVIGGHLLAEYVGFDTNVDGNIIRYYDNFVYDEDLGDGVRFVETYRCKGNSIGSLGSDFEDYVNGKVSTLIEHSFEKFPFVVVPVNTPDEVKAVIGEGTYSMSSSSGMLNANIVVEEWMQGLYHQPKVSSKLSIDRGNGASFERHIRLGEIHTMEDFENYQNGGYYRVSES